VGLSGLVLQLASLVLAAAQTRRLAQRSLEDVDQGRSRGRPLMPILLSAAALLALAATVVYQVQTRYVEVLAAMGGAHPAERAPMLAPLAWDQLQAFNLGTLLATSQLLPAAVAIGLTIGSRLRARRVGPGPAATAGFSAAAVLGVAGPLLVGI
jgi:hypothetical protein